MLPTQAPSFLEAENADRHLSLAVAALAVIEGPVPEQEALMAMLAERIRPIRRYTQVVHIRPFELSAPLWVDDARFDLSHHVRRVAVPHPGDEAALFRIVADLMERRLDRDHPLWEWWVIEGLPNGQWAVLIKMHHCIADGIAAVQMLASTFDPGAGETFATDIRAAKQPHRQRLVGPDGALTR